MNQLNSLHGEKPKEPPREWKNQPPSDHFKYRTSPSRTNPVISAITGKLNYHAIDSGDVKIPTSDFLFEYKFESVPDIETTTIKSIDDDETHHLLEFFHSEHDEDLLNIDLQMFQA